MAERVVEFKEYLEAKRNKIAEEHWDELYRWWSRNPSDFAELMLDPDRELLKGLKKAARRVEARV